MMGIFKKFFFTQIPNIITHYLHMLDTKNALPPGRAPDLCWLYCRGLQQLLTVLYIILSDLMRESKESVIRPLCSIGSEYIRFVDFSRTQGVYFYLIQKDENLSSLQLYNFTTLPEHTIIQLKHVRVILSE